MQFCPSCGRYWVPRGRDEASGKILQKCDTCGVGVKYSWLGYTILGILLYILFATTIFDPASGIALGVLVLCLILAAIKSVQQRRAANRSVQRDKQ